MATNKKEAFDTAEVSLADFAKALAHPARVAILKILAERTTCVCGELVDVLPLAQATVSQHLKELKKAGLVKGEIDGAKSCYCINWEVFEGMVGEFNYLFAGLKRPSESTECC
ncbi:ArsR/SmtB family transcription factor [Spirosoma spitsbergense]|uniref:ArsR/SmtB family transcription factor n=1 Tax=Spirosoma spitsbergense TaxID=431554 RepID=UPI0003779214|nr:metalloregulator ArsR/SmtB family transcription factor [Spirosoma spitsbergense]